jgi:predicted AlkP superfamily phosphohydrolase/phosphomutase
MRRNVTIGTATVLALLLLPLLLLLTGCGGQRSRGFHEPAMFVLGMDGLDPNLLEAAMNAGRMPNFEKLAADGDFLPLGTSLPPESPVAWANFNTGLDPGGHGIFDFIHRKWVTGRGGGRIQLYSSMVESTSPSYDGWFDDVWFFGYRIPLVTGEIKNRVRGTFYWKHLADAGIPTSVIRPPDNFPPPETGARTFSGMGTPDLLGGLGTFTYFSEVAPANVDRFPGKCFLRIVRVQGGAARDVLYGPDNTFAYPEGPRGTLPRSEVPVVIYPDAPRKVARIDIGDETRVLALGEWSDWVPVSFPLIPHVTSATGMVRVYLQSVKPLKVYVSPVNIDPRDPAMPVSTPTEAAPELAAAIGPYYTQGMAEETNAARLDVFDSGEYIKQFDLVIAERNRMLDHELERFEKEGGYTFVYYSTSDLAAHILYQHIDPKHPRFDENAAKLYGQSLEDVYAEMDRVLGRVMESVPDGTRIVVMSDHGFATVRRKLSLNSWLYEHGFLKVNYPERRGEKDDGFRYVNWPETQAYSVGFQDIYLNLYGREPNGVVMPGDEADRVCAQIIEGLEALTDPETGARVITKVYRKEDVYHGEAFEEAPDLIVGFAPGYENADESALGSVPKELIVDNDDAWSGSHLMDPIHVPGVLLANKKFTLRDPELRDLTVTILAEFGIDAGDLPGRRIWK